MDQGDFAIIKHERKTPSPAMGKLCEIKFFTPRELSNTPNEAEAFLLEKFNQHYCKVLRARARKRFKSVENSA
jgi:hypothetical protein